jgi:phosphatidylserine/phosphatidylglycerophosphate/cardiolipin synthase-like enzyme
MKTQYTLLQKQIDPKLTALFKETNPHHPDIISDDNGFSIVIEDWDKGIYRFVNSTKKYSNLPVGVYKQGKKYYASMSKGDEGFKSYLKDTPEEAFQVYKFEKEKHTNEIAEQYKN